MLRTHFRLRSYASGALLTSLICGRQVQPKVSCRRSGRRSIAPGWPWRPTADESLACHHLGGSVPHRREPKHRQHDHHAHQSNLTTGIKRQRTLRWWRLADTHSRKAGAARSIPALDLLLGYAGTPLVACSVLLPGIRLRSGNQEVRLTPVAIPNQVAALRAFVAGAYMNPNTNCGRCYCVHVAAVCVRGNCVPISSRRTSPFRYLLQRNIRPPLVRSRTCYYPARS
jgi:hypothetical protein